MAIQLVASVYLSDASIQPCLSKRVRQANSGCAYLAGGCWKQSEDSEGWGVEDADNKRVLDLLNKKPRNNNRNHFRFFKHGKQKKR